MYFCACTFPFTQEKQETEIMVFILFMMKFRQEIEKRFKGRAQRAPTPRLLGQ